MDAIDYIMTAELLAQQYPTFGLSIAFNKTLEVEVKIHFQLQKH